MDIDRSGVTPGVLVEGTDFEIREWDALSRSRREESSFAVCVLQRNSLGWVTRESMTFNVPVPASQTSDVVLEYNDAGALASLLYPDGLDLNYHRNDLDQITRIETAAVGSNYPGSPLAASPRDIASFDYEGRHRSRARFPNGAEIAFRYDGARRLIQVDHSTGGQAFLSLQQLFDACGNVRFRNDLTPGFVNGELYRYDSAGRLSIVLPDQMLPVFAAASFAPSSAIPPDPLPHRQSAIDAVLGSLAQTPGQFTFAYDSVGNRVLERPAGAPPITYTVNNLDQYTTVAASHLLYDLNGNLVLDGSRKFLYDAFNRLVRVVNSSTGVDIFRCFHDAQGRRIFETEGAISTHLIHSGLNLIAEYRAGLPFAEYAFDDGIDRPVLLATEKTDQWYHADSVGSVRALTNGAGAVTSYQYTAFGTPLGGSSAPYNPMRFAGRRLDLGLGTYDVRARQYDPVLGRFLQRDPIGMADGTNLYTYGGNNPQAYRDPLGTKRDRVQTVKQENESSEQGTSLTGGYGFFGLAPHSKGGIALTGEGLVLGGYDTKRGTYLATLTGGGLSKDNPGLRLHSGGATLATERIHYFRSGEDEREKLLLGEGEIGKVDVFDFGLGAFINREDPRDVGIFGYGAIGSLTGGAGVTLHLKIDFLTELREAGAKAGIDVVVLPEDIAEAKRRLEFLAKQGIYLVRERTAPPRRSPSVWSFQGAVGSIANFLGFDLDRLADDEVKDLNKFLEKHNSPLRVQQAR